jgi:hypothetical protein
MTGFVDIVLRIVQLSTITEYYWLKVRYDALTHSID